MTLTQEAPTGTIHGKGSRLVLRGLRKRYASQTAIDDVSLDVEPGEFMTLLGPSGSGKTTTLNTISGFTELDAGSILMDGVDIAKVPPRKRGIGMVFQNYALFPHMTAAQNIAFPLAQRKVPKRERDQQVELALEIVRLSGYGDRRPAELSGGQQQRVALARAIVFEPGLLLMDEPLGALDRGLRESMQAELRRIHRDLGSTVILVTHDQEEALALSDRIAVFKDGRIEQVGTGQELYARPESLFVAKFLGESTIFGGPVTHPSGGAVLDYEGQVLPAPVSTTPVAGAGALVIRPENAVVIPEGWTVPEGHVSLPGKVIDDVYLGASRRISVAFADGSAGVVRNTESGDAPLPSGAAVSFAWRPERTVLVPAD
jgi:putative spermidine/putrescine transport system ATP-binding protein